MQATQLDPQLSQSIRGQVMPRSQGFGMLLVFVVVIVTCYLNETSVLRKRCRRITTYMQMSHVPPCESGTRLAAVSTSIA